MPRTPEAQISPALLVWARKASGLELDDAAKKIGVSEDRLAEWETGDSRPSVAQLRKAGSIYKRPLAVFFLSEPPTDFQPLSDFRRLPDAESRSYSPELRQAVRRAQFQREVLIELRSINDDPVRPAPVLERAYSDPELFAREARSMLPSLEEQLGWSNVSRALNAWISALEELDILVLHSRGIEITEMRGFSISEPIVPVVVLNGSDSARGRIFTVLHEFAHILLRDGGVCDLHQRQDPGDFDLEVYCNRAAGALLLPAEAFLSEGVIREHQGGGEWTDSDIGSLSDRYSVSQEVIVRRLFDLGLASWDFLQQKRSEYLEAYEEYKRREAESTGGPSWYRVHVRDFGRAYIQTALDAYYRSEINASELSDYVEVKVNNLEKLEAELARGASSCGALCRYELPDRVLDAVLPDRRVPWALGSARRACDEWRDRGPGRGVTR